MYSVQFGLDVLFPSLGSGDSKYHVNDLFYVKVLILIGGLVVSAVCIWYTHKFVPDGRLDYEAAGTTAAQASDKAGDPLEPPLAP